MLRLQTGTGGYKIAGWEGETVGIKEDPRGYGVIVADRTGYRRALPENEREKLERESQGGGQKR
jgi:hypothetical protein